MRYMTGYVRILDIEERADFLAGCIRPGALLGVDPATTFSGEGQRDYACKILWTGTNPHPLILKSLTKGYSRERKLADEFYDLVAQCQYNRDIGSKLNVAVRQKESGHFLIVPEYSTTRALVMKVRPLAKRGRISSFQSKVSA